MLVEPTQQLLVAQVDAVVGADRYNTAPLTLAQIDKAADKLHGPLKPLIHKRLSIRVLPGPWGPPTERLETESPAGPVAKARGSSCLPVYVNPAESTSPVDLDVTFLALTTTWPISRLPAPRARGSKDDHIHLDTTCLPFVGLCGGVEN